MPASSETATQPRASLTDGFAPPTVASREVAWAGLIWTLVRTDFKSRYHGTLSGFVWALLKPTAMFAVLVTVFSFVFSSEPTYKLDLVIGLFLWDFYADATKTGMIALSAKSFLLNKATFPRWIVIVTAIANPLITLIVFAAVLTLFLLLTGQHVAPLSVAAFGLYLGALAMLAVGISLGSSVLFLRYRDLNQIWDMATQAGFFIAPIVYPLGVIPERFHFWLFLWPPTPIIEFSRMALVDGRLPTFRAHAYLALQVLVVLGVGVLLYRRFAPRAAEYA